MIKSLKIMAFLLFLSLGTHADGGEELVKAYMTRLITNQNFWIAHPRNVTKPEGGNGISSLETNQKSKNHLEGWQGWKEIKGIIRELDANFTSEFLAHMTVAFVKMSTAVEKVMGSDVNPEMVANQAISSDMKYMRKHMDEGNRIDQILSKLDRLSRSN